MTIDGEAVVRVGKTISEGELERAFYRATVHMAQSFDDAVREGIGNHATSDAAIGIIRVYLDWVRLVLAVPDPQEEP